MNKCLRPGETGTVMIADIDTASIVTRDLSDDRRSARAIEEYALAYSSGAKFPAVDVYLVDGKMVLVDGDHRVKARIALNEISVVARCVGKGSREDALRYALKDTNRAHGLRLSQEDCRLRVYLALDSGIWDSPSASVLASDIGLSAPTARKYMQEWEEARGIEAPVARVDSKGRRQPTRRAAKVVRQTGTDVETFSVRDNLAQSELPPPFDDDTPSTATPMPAYGHALLRGAAQVRALRLELLRDLPDAAGLTGPRQQFEQSLKAAEATLKLAEPIVCSKCDGAGCTRCGKQGWLTRLAAGER